MKSFNKISLILTVILCTLSALCVAACIMLFICGVRSEVYAEKQEGSTGISSELPETYDYGDGYIKSILWVGDRTLASLTSSPDIKPSQFCAGEDGTLRLENKLSCTPVMVSGKKYPSLADATAERKPEYMIITIGLDNGVGYCTEEKFKEYYSKLIESVKDASPDTLIILQSIFPVSASTEKASPSISNDRIREVNVWISRIGEEQSVRYLNTHSILTDEKGCLKAEYDSGDGIVLNQAGCQAMLGYVRTHGYK